VRIDIKDLPLNLQKQALRKLAEAEKRNGIATNSEVMSGEGNVMDCRVLQRKCIEEQCEAKAKPTSKYHAKKETLTLSDGTEHTFDSKHEAKVYQELALMERSGEISNLQLQVPFVLIDTQKAPSGKTYRNCKYIADFVFTDADGNTQVWDAKGFRTSQFQIKKKLMLERYGIEIKEV